MLVRAGASKRFMATSGTVVLFADVDPDRPNSGNVDDKPAPRRIIALLYTSATLLSHEPSSVPENLLNSGRFLFSSRFRSGEFASGELQRFTEVHARTHAG